MKNTDVSMVQEVIWTDVRDEVITVNPELASIIDELDTGKKYKLIKASYNYGDLIVKDGVTYLPINDSRMSLLPLVEASREIKFLSKLTYSSIPLTLTLKNINEVYLDTGLKTVPLNIFHPGNLLGLFETLNYIYKLPNSPKWSVSAGARSIFMLPKLTEAGSFKRLRLEYNLSSTLHIRGFGDHWKLFKALANHQNFTQPWKNEVLFFCSEWFNHVHDPSWSTFYSYLMKSAWQQAQFAISKIDVGLNWDYFTKIIASRNLKPSLYITDQVKQIMHVASGKWPAVRPVNKLQTVAPTQGIQEAIVNIYQLKNYLPTIMYADMLKADDSLPVYYSLYYPFLLEGSTKNNSASTIMLDLREIKQLIDIFNKDGNEQGKFCSEIINKFKFEYFHVEPDKYLEIKSSLHIAQGDPSLLNDRQIYEDRIFCSTSSFWRGCIRISNSN